MFKKIRSTLTALILLFSVVQLVMFPEITNITCVFMAAASSITAVHMLLKRHIVLKYTITSLQVLIFALSNLALPILATTLEFHPLVFNLEVPLETFSMVALLTFVLLLTHWFYRSAPPLRDVRNFVTRHVHKPMGVFTKPSDAQLWLMGLMGVFAIVYVQLFVPDGGAGAEGGVGSKVLMGLTNFAYAPMLIPLSFLYSTQRQISTAQKFVFGTYFLLILGLALLQNSRGLFVLLAFTMLASVVIGYLTFRLPLPRISAEKIILLFVVGFVASNVLADLATAMVVARVQNGKLKPLDLAKASLDVFMDKDKMSLFTESKQISGMAQWSEYYVKNPFMSRFISIKFHDNILYLVGEEDANDRENLKNVMIEKTWALLPTPLLAISGVTVNKDTVIKSSVGDYIWYFHSGRGLESKRVGSFIGTGVAMFGYLFFLLAIPFYLIIFPFFDSFSYNPRINPATLSVDSGTGERKTRYDRPIFSAIFLLNFTQVLFWINMESISGYLEFFIRYFPQMVLLYVAIFWVTRRLTGSFLSTGGRSRRTSAPLTQS